jgi:hypothetical protein
MSILGKNNQVNIEIDSVKPTCIKTKIETGNPSKAKRKLALKDLLVT